MIKLSLGLDNLAYIPHQSAKRLITCRPSNADPEIGWKSPQTAIDCFSLLAGNGVLAGRVGVGRKPPLARDENAPVRSCLRFVGALEDKIVLKCRESVDWSQR